MTPRKLLSRQLSKPEVYIVLDILKAGHEGTSYAGHPGVDSLVRRGWQSAASHQPKSEERINISFPRDPMPDTVVIPDKPVQ